MNNITSVPNRAVETGAVFLLVGVTPFVMLTLFAIYRCRIKDSRPRAADATGIPNHRTPQVRLFLRFMHIDKPNT